MTLESKAEFARRHAVSRPAVQKWERAGWLVLHEGKVDVEATNAQLARYRNSRDARATGAGAARKPEPQSKPAKGSKPGPQSKPRASKPGSDGSDADSSQPSPRARRAAIAAKPDETPAQAAERLLATASADMGYEEAKRVKEKYLALLNQLEYDEKSRAVVKVSDVAEIVGAELATVRTKLMAIPSEHAPRLMRLKTAVEMQDTLLQIIVEALSELTQDVVR